MWGRVTRLRASQPIADRMPQNLEMISKNFDLVPGVPGFSLCVWNHTHHFVYDGYHVYPCTHRKSHGQNSGTLKKNWTSSHDSVPPCLRLAARPWSRFFSKIFGKTVFCWKRFIKGISACPSRHHHNKPSRICEYCCRLAFISHPAIIIHSDMVWLRIVSSLNLHVSFVKEPYKRYGFLQKRPMIVRSLLIVATP